MKKAIFIILLLSIVHYSTIAQTCTGTWGPPIVNQTFGQGAAGGTQFFGPLSTYAPGVTTSTNFVYSHPSDNYSALTYNTSSGSNVWCNTTDHTGNPLGLMLEINAPSSGGSVFVKYTMHDLCPNTLLKLSVWILNADAGVYPQSPDMNMQVIDSATNTVLDNIQTGNVPFDCTWHNYNLIFNNGNSGTVTLQFINNSVGDGSGNDLAIDDITVSACVPITHISPRLDTAICQAQAVNIPFTANIAGNVYTPAEYQWQYSADMGGTWINALPAGPVDNYNFTSSVRGTYWIRFLVGPSGSAGNNACSAISDTSIVTIGTPAVPPIVTDSVAGCEGYQLLPISQVVIGANLLWYTSATGGNGSTFAPIPFTGTAGTTTYYVSQTINGCESARVPVIVDILSSSPLPVVTTPVVYCQYDNPLPLQVLGVSLVWATGSVNGPNSTAAPVVSTAVADTQKYYVSQTTGGCRSGWALITVVVNSKPPLPDINDTTLCLGDGLATKNEQLLWYTNNTSSLGNTNLPINATGSTTWYVSQVVNGCESDRKAVKITINPQPLASVNAAARTYLCQGDTMSFYAGDKQYINNYTWEIPEGASIINNGQGTGAIVVRFDSSGNNTITLTVANGGCNATTMYTVYVRPEPTAIIDAKPDICIGQQTKVTIYRNDTGATYNIYLGGADIVNSSDSVYGIYTLQWDNAGSYVISVNVNSKECPAQAAKDTVNVHGLPVAAIKTATTQDICAGDTILLAADGINNANKYEWAPREAVVNSTGVETGAIILATEYIKLKVTSLFSCIAADSLLIHTYPCCDVYLPTAFTPNGDGHNDVFRLISTGHHKISDFRIMNRWGQAIFETINENEGWNGTFKGTPQEAGTYYYYIKYLCYDGKFYEKEGDVTLVR